MSTLPKYNFGAANRGYGKSLGSSLGESFGELAANTPAYDQAMTREFRMGTPEGQNEFSQDQKNRFNADAVGQGHRMANNIAFSGGGASAQDAARMMATQQGYQAGNNAQAQMGTPQAQLGYLQLMHEAMSNLGTNNPAFQAWNALYGNYMNQKKIDNEAPVTPGLFGQILGAAAPVGAAYAGK